MAKILWITFEHEIYNIKSFSFSHLFIKYQLKLKKENKINLNRIILNESIYVEKTCFV